MDLVHARCAGLDVSKRDAKLCVRVAGAGRAGPRSTVTTWGAVTTQVLALRDHLIAEQVTLVVMEATGDYWKPFYYLLDDGPFEVLLVNARHVKNLPGRKTDVSDAAWLAQLGAHGLVRGSFVPPEPIRQLRDLTRTRTTMVRTRAREIQRLEKLLEDAGIKLSSVASDISGVSGRAMLEALISGQRDPAQLAELAKRRLRSKIPALTEALTGRFTEHHAFLARLHLDVIDQHSHAIAELTARIEVVIEPFRGARELLTSIPGISVGVADVIIAETGVDMSRSPPPVTWRRGPGPVPAATSPPAGSSPPRLDPATPTSKAPSASPRCRPPTARTPTSRPSSDASPPDAARSRRSSRSSTPSSSPSGTCSPTASSTRISAVTSTPDATLTRRNSARSPNSSSWATTSP